MKVKNNVAAADEKFCAAETHDPSIRERVMKIYARLEMDEKG